MIIQHSRRVTYEANTAPHDLQAARHCLIERRAFHKWHAKGQPANSAIQDWLEAEAEIDAELRANGFVFVLSSPMPCPVLPL